MDIIILGSGTSQGVPVIACRCPVCLSADKRDHRLRTSVLIRSGTENIIIDAGPDFRQQVLGQNLHTLDAVLITHGHRDHIAGLDDVRSFNYLTKKAFDIYCNKVTRDTLMAEFNYAFDTDPYPGVPQFNIRIVNGNFIIGKIEVIPIHAIHAKMPILGFRIGDFSYVTDASFIEDQELEKIKGSRVFIINALRKKKHHSHYNLEEALDVIRKVNPEKAFLTHISHQMGLYKDENPLLPEGVEMAYDGLQIEVI